MKRLLSIMLALMLMLSMTATAFAADGKVDPTPVTEVWLTKTYNDNIGHAAKFSFDIVGNEEGDNRPLLRIASIEYTAIEHGGSKSLPLVFDLSAAEPGTYEYTVSENQDGAINTDREKLVMSQASYTVQVRVERKDGELVITDISVTQISNPDNPDSDGQKVDAGNPGDGNANGFNFVNTYAQVAGPEDPTKGSLRISKTVENGIDSEQQFSFRVSFTYPNGITNPFIPMVSFNGGRPTALEATKLSSEFTLKDTEYAVFTGLPIGTVVNVTETGTQNFTPSATLILNGVNSKPVNATVGADLEITGKPLGAKENSIAVTNTYAYAPATGVILNVMPYVLMVAIAGGMIVLFTVMKRRKAQDFED